MRLYLVVLAAFCLTLSSCGGGSKAVPAAGDDAADSAAVDSLAVDSLEAALGGTPMPETADELFDDFIFNFAASRKLQMERIMFPLLVVHDKQKEKIQRRDWKTEHLFMPQGYYSLLFDSEQQMEIVKDTTVCHAVVEKLNFDSGDVRQYVFDRLMGKWMLTAIRVVPIAYVVNASFLDFLHHFVSDPEFQKRSLASTVDFVGPDPDDDFRQMEGVITPDTWEAFAPELPAESFFNIVYGKPTDEGSRKVFVLRGIANGMELQMTFRKRGGAWKLTQLIT